MARRTIRIVSGGDLTGGQYAGRGKLTTVNDLSRRRARHDARCPWQWPAVRATPAAGGVTAIRSGAVTMAEAADAFLSSPRVASPIPTGPTSA